MIRIKVEGLRELDKALMTMKQSTARGVVRRVLLKAAQPIADDMAQRAPRDTGYLGDHIDTGIRLSRRQSKISPKRSDVEVFAGASRVIQATLQEFGTSDAPPHPFARPAWDAGKMQALDDVKTGLATEIEKTAARAAKRALKK
jgi:HK97 gp10 family phage protein